MRTQNTAQRHSKAELSVLCSSKQEKAATQRAASGDRVTANWNWRRHPVWGSGEELARFRKSF